MSHAVGCFCSSTVYFKSSCGTFTYQNEKQWKTSRDATDMYILICSREQRAGCQSLSLSLSPQVTETHLHIFYFNVDKYFQAVERPQKEKSCPTLNDGWDTAGTVGYRDSVSTSVFAQLSQANTSWVSTHSESVHINEQKQLMLIKSMTVSELKWRTKFQTMSFEMAFFRVQDEKTLDAAFLKTLTSGTKCDS